MKQKIITSFLIVALTHYFLGCAMYQTNEVSKAEALTQSNRVLYLVLRSGEEVTFNEKYGDVVLEPAGVTGKTKFGDLVRIPESEIDEMFGRDKSPITIEKLQGDSTIRISTIKLWADTVEFDGNGGRFTQDNSVIKGITTEGKFYEIPFSKVKLVVMRDLSIIPSIFVSILLIAAGIFGSFFIGLAIAWEID